MLKKTRIMNGYILYCETQGPFGRIHTNKEMLEDNAKHEGFKIGPDNWRVLPCKETIEMLEEEPQK